MKKLFAIGLFLSIFLLIFSLFVVGCTCGGTTSKGFYLLVNKTNSALNYKACSVTFCFDTLLAPNDTLFLYSIKSVSGDDFVEDPTYFEAGATPGGTIVIKNDDDKVLFYRFGNTEQLCGETDFVSSKRGKRDYYYNYHWTITPEYIAEKSCNMSLEELEKE
ncbi:MAG: hypothetical protein FWF51_00830 [Chitinivibrionia bacterium]|nr:hypothetical protein [Chitinivibrionia bacterium]